MVPEETTRALLDGEVAAIEAWAARHGWSVEIDTIRLALAATVRHPADGSLLLIVSDFHGYRALPPAWRFVDPLTGQPGGSGFPAGGPLPGGKGSIFHPNAVICAPWNRLAYQEEGGPHNDWGGATNWLSEAGEVTRAGNIAEMLSAMHVHLGHSPGRLG